MVTGVRWTSYLDISSISEAADLCWDFLTQQSLEKQNGGKNFLGGSSLFDKRSELNGQIGSSCQEGYSNSNNQSDLKVYGLQQQKTTSWEESEAQNHPIWTLTEIGTLIYWCWGWYGALYMTFYYLDPLGYSYYSVTERMLRSILFNSMLMMMIMKCCGMSARQSQDYSSSLHICNII